MPHRFNFTGRKRIRRESVELRLRKTDGHIALDANLQLAEYGFVPSARIFLEAYRPASTQWKRFDLGRVGVPSDNGAMTLDEFERPEGILFRIKITSDGPGGGKIVGEADALRPVLPDEATAPRTPLIDPVPGDDLGGEVWRVSFAAERPQLLVNSRIVGWKEVVRDSTFRSLVAPSVMRQVLTKVLVIDKNAGDEDDPLDWRQNWIRFAEQLPGIGECPDVDEASAGNLEQLESWIDDAVGRFGERVGLLESYRSLVDQGGGS